MPSWKRLSKIFVMLVLFVLGWIAANTYRTFQEQGEIPQVKTIPVTEGRIRDKISLTTKVQECQMVNITSAVEKGLVEKIYVRPGDYVQIGQRLIELRKEELTDTLKKEGLNLEKAKEKQALLKDIFRHPEIIEKEEEQKKLERSLVRARQKLQDKKELFAKQAIAYQEVEEQELEVKELEMNLSKVGREKEEMKKRLEREKKELEVEIPSLEHRISELKDQLKNCVVVSPIKGLVRNINVEKNKKVEYGSMLLSIADQSQLIAKGSLKEANFFLVKVGQKTEFASDVLGKRYSGRILKIIPAFATKDAEGKKDGDGFEVIASIEEPSGLVVGMVLSCDIIIKERKTSRIVIPPEALYEEKSVLVVEKGRLKKKEVQLGEGTTDQIEVLSGLKLGERVVVQYPEEIKEGMRVKEETVQPIH